MDTNETSEQNPAEPKPDIATVAEAGQPENTVMSQETVMSSLELNQENEVVSETIKEIQNVVIVNGIDEGQEVHFAAEATVFKYVLSEESIAMVSSWMHNFLDDWITDIHMRIPLSVLQSIAAEKKNKFVQTFFKAMTKISDRRFIEMINIHIDHANVSLVFYCPSYELLDSFDDDDDDKEETTDDDDKEEATDDDDKEDATDDDDKEEAIDDDDKEEATDNDDKEEAIDDDDKEEGTDDDDKKNVTRKQAS